MMKDRTQEPEAGSPELEGRAGPSATHVTASERFASIFERIREEGDELLRLERVAKNAFATTSPSSFDGLSHLLDMLLPRGALQQERIARVLTIELSVLKRLRASSIDPFDVDPRPLAALARVIELDFSTFWLLAQRDHERVASRARPRSRSAHATPNIEATFRCAWERDTLDDASPT
jgi:hypothetical protein